MTTIIAEIGHNHNGNSNIAFDLIERAKEAGSDVAKFQLYDTKKIVAPDHKWYWDLERGQLTKGQWLQVVEKCKQVGIEFLASAFDVERVGWCEEVGMKRYKIASRSIYDTELLEAVGKTGKDVIISLGKVKDNRIPRVNGVKNDYLYCIAQYPATLSSLKLSQVDFVRHAGFSDHTIGIEAAIVAISRGARIIEKHFTLSKAMAGCDHAGSCEPKELKALVDFARKYEEIK